MKFSKTSILAGMQRAKHLHLALYHPEWPSPFKSPTTVTGQVVGDYARSEYPGGILLERTSRDGDLFISTAELMRLNPL